MKKVYQVYLAHAVGTSRYKIGYSADADYRLRTLNSGQSPYPLVLVATTALHTFAQTTEKRYHAMFSDKRVHGEWFELSRRDVELFLYVSVRRPDRKEITGSSLAAYQVRRILAKSDNLSVNVVLSAAAAYTADEAEKRKLAFAMLLYCHQERLLKISVWIMLQAVFFATYECGGAPAVYTPQQAVTGE